MKKYFKPIILVEMINETDVISTSLVEDLGENFDNGNIDVSWGL